MERTSITTAGFCVGPAVVFVYINVFLEIVKSHCKLFEDGAKINKEVNNAEDFEGIHGDLFNLCSWTSKWLILFKFTKVKGSAL